MLYSRLFSEYLSPLKPEPTSIKRKGVLREKIEAVFFDVYGTLLISGSGDIGTAATTDVKPLKLEKLLLKYHLQDSVAALRKKLVTIIQIRHAEMKSAGIDFPEIRIEEIWTRITGIQDRHRARQFALEYELITNPVYPMPHMQAVLEFFVKRDILLGIVSNAQFYTPLVMEWFLQKKLTDFGFRDSFLIFSYRMGRAKPSTGLFDLAHQQITKHGLIPGRVLYVGNDMLNDIYPAKAVGFNTALFAGDRRSLRLRRDDPRCKGIEPDIVITDLMQLTEYVSG